MGAVARPAACDAAGTEPGPDTPVGSVQLNPRLSKAVNDHAIGCMIIYWTWLKSYLNTA